MFVWAQVNSWVALAMAAGFIGGLAASLMPKVAEGVFRRLNKRLKRPLKRVLGAWARFTGNVGPEETEARGRALMRLGMALHASRDGAGWVVRATFGNRRAISRARHLWVAYGELEAWARGVG